MDFTTRRITGIRNGFNGFESQCDAILVPTNIGDIVIINETDDNPGPSITNCAEYACPVIAVAFGLQFGKTLFVESYSHREHYLEFDCSYDLIRFHGLVSMRQAYNHTTPVPFALQPRPGWSLLPESHIQALTDAGFMLSRIIGRIGTFRKRINDGAGTVDAKILSYNGHSYETDKGQFLHDKIMAVEGVAPSPRTKRSMAGQV